MSVPELPASQAGARGYFFLAVPVDMPNQAICPGGIPGENVLIAFPGDEEWSSFREHMEFIHG